MLIDRAPSRAATAELRGYIAAGGRDVEFRLGPRIRPEAVLREQTRNGELRVEVVGSELRATRGPDAGSSIVTLSPRVHPLTFAGTIDGDAGIVRGRFDCAMQAANDRHLALKVLGPAVVLGVVLGLVHWYVGVVGFVVLAALLWGLARATRPQTAIIEAHDLWRLAVLIGSPAER